jgi:polysaccharide export outer membrane protein
MKTFRFYSFFAFMLFIIAGSVATAQTSTSTTTTQQQNQQTSQEACRANPNSPECGSTIRRPEIDNASDSNLRNALPSDTTVGVPEQPTPDARAVEQPVNPSDIGRKNPRPEPPTEFQRLVSDSVGIMLPIFGEQFFEQPPSTFAPMNQGNVQGDYVIGPGDELIVRVWGSVNFQARVTVGRDGQIYIPKVGAVVIAGTKFSDMEQRLRSEIERVYRNFQISVSMGRLRTIEVFIVGQVRYPGKYSLSSLSTVVNAIFESGGPTLKGSMRRLRLSRNGKLVNEFDLYDLLIGGDRSKDVSLQSGDVIDVPSVGPQVAITGSVVIPSIYEIKSGESLGDVVKLAGGLSVVADTKSTIIERIDENSTRQVEQLALDAQGLAVKVRGGDLIRVMSISPRFDKAITIRGNIANPGRYPFRDGMHVSDLIPDRASLLTRDFWVQQNKLVSGCATDYPTEPADRKSGTKDSSDTERMKRCLPAAVGGVSDQQLRADVKIAHPGINWEYAVVQRLDPVDLSYILVPFNLGEAIAKRGSSDDVPLQPGDIITIFSQKDVAVPESDKSKFVKVEGEVKAPGIYRIANDETIDKVIERAGGLTNGAYLYGLQLTRESAKQQQHEMLQQSVDMMQQQLEQAVVSSAASTADASAASGMQAEAGRRWLERLRTIPVTGRVVLQMKPTDNQISEIPKLTLEDGDRIVVPHTQKTVNVIGSVFTQSAYLYDPKKEVGDYVRLAGNGMKNADRKHILVVRADGSVFTMGSSLWSGGIESQRVLPGDTIVIPAKQLTGTWVRALRDWGQIASQFAIAAASLAVISGH